jgi:hypothetical protein
MVRGGHIDLSILGDVVAQMENFVEDSVKLLVLLTQLLRAGRRATVPSVVGLLRRWDVTIPGARTACGFWLSAKAKSRSHSTKFHCRCR